MQADELDRRELELAQNPDSTEEIPTLDISAYIAGEEGALDRCAAELRHISETVGFFQLVGHDVPQEKIDGVFAQSRRFHQLPVKERRRLPSRTPEMPIGYEGYEDQVLQPGKPVANLVSSYLFYIERGENDPKVDPNDPYRVANVWPDDQWLPGFRAPIMDYYLSVERLALKMLPLWARALDLPADYFAPYFTNPWLSLALAHYPPKSVTKERLYGIKPHTDNTVMTILKVDEVPGLVVRMPSGHWRLVQAQPGAFVINTGNSLSRWSNGRFLSTKHHVINNDDRGRYSIPVFFGADLDAVIECVPSCDTQDSPAQYPPITYRALQDWYFFGGGVQEKAVGPDVKSEGKWIPV